MTKAAKKDKVMVKKTKLAKVIKTSEEQNVSAVPMTDTNAENENPDHVIRPTEKAVTSGINALLQLLEIEKDDKKKTALFNDDPKEILLHIVPIKIPITHRQEIRISLPHPMAIEGSDVCLITTDVKKSTKNDHEPTIAYYKSLLQEKKIKGITEIVPIRQLRSEYVPYELRGRFSSLYDIYLVDGRLYGKVTKILGSRFFKKHKDLIPVKINTRDVKRELEQALTKTVLSVHGKGDCFSVKIGYSHFSTEQLKDNVDKVAEELAKKFPGGFKNIRKLFIKSGTSMAIPIYLSLKPSNEVPVPVVRPNLPKAYRPVEGELSTIVGGHVTVQPTGEVKVKVAYTEDDIEMGYGYGSYGTAAEPEEEEDARHNDDEDVDVKPAQKKRRAAAAGGDSSDDDVEAAEDAYVMGIQNQDNSAGKSRSKKEKKTPKLGPSKAKKEASPANAAKGLTKNKKLKRVSTGDERGTPNLKTTPKVKPGKVRKDLELEEMVSPKKLKATPKVKPGKIREIPEPEDIVIPTKLNGTPKVKPGKIQESPESKEIVLKNPKATRTVKPGKMQEMPEPEEMNIPTKLKATPKIKPGKVRKDSELEEMVTSKKLKAAPKVKRGKVTEDAGPEEMGLQDMIAQLLASKQEDLDVLVKSKKKTKPDGDDSKSTPKTRSAGHALRSQDTEASLELTSITKKKSDTKKETKSAKKSPVLSKEKAQRVIKTFPRYFSSENQKLLS